MASRSPIPDDVRARLREAIARAERARSVALARRALMRALREIEAANAALEQQPQESAVVADLIVRTKTCLDQVPELEDGVAELVARLRRDRRSWRSIARAAGVTDVQAQAALAHRLQQGYWRRRHGRVTRRRGQ